jgi:hypothetical protein
MRDMVDDLSPDTLLFEVVTPLKDKQGRVVGFEKLNFSVAGPEHERLQVIFETVAA